MSQSYITSQKLVRDPFRAGALKLSILTQAELTSVTVCLTLAACVSAQDWGSVRKPLSCFVGASRMKKNASGVHFFFFFFWWWWY
jgi:hypothetical protein